MIQVRRFVKLLVFPLILLLAAPAMVVWGEIVPGEPVGHFVPIATYKVTGATAEIVDVTPDGMTLVYVDSADQEVSFVDITDPAAPGEIARFSVMGEPTSVAVTPDGQWALTVVDGRPDDSFMVVARTADYAIERIIPLGGQPDSVAISTDGRYAAIAIENERDESAAGDFGRMPQDPPGFLTIVDLVGPPDDWTLRDVSLVGLAHRFPTDPEPEWVDINDRNQVAITLQENNHVVIVDLADGSIITHWPAGTVTQPADTRSDGVVSFTDMIVDAPREPDTIKWTPGGHLAMANEGDYNVDLAPGQFAGGRSFTIFTMAGEPLYHSGAELEMEAARQGLYNDSRSASKGCEFEGAEAASYYNQDFLFIGAERCHFVAVYRIKESKPKLVQLLPTGEEPEGILAIPHRGLLVATNEEDGTISLFQGQPGNPR